MRKPRGLNLNLFKRKVKIYDVEKKALIKECESICEAQRFLGITCASHYLKSKHRCKKNKLGITVALR